jgi:acetyltransferase-like isoleucine patch superfamily enzyme
MSESTADAIAQIFRDNPFSPAMQILMDRVCRRIRGAIISSGLQAPELRLGPGCRILGGRHMRLGRGISAGRNLWLEAVTSYGSQKFLPQVIIGNNVCFSNCVHISSISSVSVGNGVLFGSHIYVGDHNHGVYRGDFQNSPDEPPARRKLGGGGPVIIEDNVWIGDNTVILGPAHIGRGSIVGAGSLVRGTVPPGSIVGGAPCRILKIFNSETNQWEAQ